MTFITRFNLGDTGGFKPKGARTRRPAVIVTATLYREDTGGPQEYGVHYGVLYADRRGVERYAKFDEKDAGTKFRLDGTPD